MIRPLLIGLGGVILAGAALAQDLPAGDRAAGKALAGQCRTCHGLDGASKLVNAPSIGGQPEAYLAAQIAAFREGTRVNEMMTIVTQSLTDQQIADLAAWYAGHAASVEAPDPSGAPEACVSCHGADGIAVVEGTPNLAGLGQIYITEQLEAFRSGARQNEVMSGIAAELDDATIREVADWYDGIRYTIKTAE